MNSTLNSAIDVSRGHRFFGELTEQLSADGPIELHRLRAVAQYVAENPTRFLSWLKEMLQDGVACIRRALGISLDRTSLENGLAKRRAAPPTPSPSF